MMQIEAMPLSYNTLSAHVYSLLGCRLGAFLLLCNALSLILFAVALQTVAAMALHMMNVDGIFR